MLDGMTILPKNDAVVAVRMPVAEREALEERARKYVVPLSFLVRRAIQAYLAVDEDPLGDLRVQVCAVENVRGDGTWRCRLLDGHLGEHEFARIDLYA